jgi:hypothetical protein
MAASSITDEEAMKIQLLQNLGTTDAKELNKMFRTTLPTTSLQGDRGPMELRAGATLDLPTEAVDHLRRKFADPRGNTAMFVEV